MVPVSLVRRAGGGADAKRGSRERSNTLEEPLTRSDTLEEPLAGDGDGDGRTLARRPPRRLMAADPAGGKNILSPLLRIERSSSFVWGAPARRRR